MVIVVGALVVHLDLVLRLGWVNWPVKERLKLLLLFQRLWNWLSVWRLHRSIESLPSSYCYSTTLLLVVLLDIR